MEVFKAIIDSPDIDYTWVFIIAKNKESANEIFKEYAKPFILSRAQPLRETGAHIFQIDIPAGEYDFILRYPRSLYHGTTPTLLMVHGVEFLSGT